MCVDTAKHLDYSIKWSRAVKADLGKNIVYEFIPENIVSVLYRPFVKLSLYYDRKLNEMRYQLPTIFGDKAERNTRAITFTDSGSQKPFFAIACNSVFDYHLAGASAASVAIPELGFDQDRSIENVTDWGYDQFRRQYEPSRTKPKRPIS